MVKTRLEAFSDGVFAIIITIMVLELKVPHGSEWADLTALWAKFSSYVLSFVFVGIYWVNHHHMIHAVKQVNGSMMWGNLNLLFWLSLIPFVTSWMGENHFSAHPVAAYSIVLFLCAISYRILQNIITRSHNYPEAITRAFKKSMSKAVLSMVLYVVAFGFTFINTGVSAILFLTVSFLWMIPDRNLERAMKEIME
ncbi:MAG: Integral membrane protein [Cytophagales bacterium]|jgi:uncharacterized membrane protein|nr:DUF1211 domain-containing protein [Bacteroidota bacterium]MBS1981060.1 DUF1211 domain-containing protein [Bacteroidota bacterium]WHZ08422.1 MAG: Integral membrane protein [Cytophagales bacterium]